MSTNYLHSDITGAILKAFFNVYNEIGIGFLEKVYENSMLVELDNLGYEARSQYPIEVYYREELVGSYYADLLVENKVIVEIKATECLSDAHEAQLVNYLRATEFEVGILLNFGKTPQHKRKVLTKDYKKKR